MEETKFYGSIMLGFDGAATHDLCTTKDVIQEHLGSFTETLAAALDGLGIKLEWWKFDSDTVILEDE